MVAWVWFRLVIVFALACAMASFGSGTGVPLARAQTAAEAANGPPLTIAVLVSTRSDRCYDPGDAAAIAKLAAAEQDMLGNSADENAQKWRADRVRSWIACAWYALGDDAKRQEYAVDLEASELERISLEEGRRLEAEALEDYLVGVDAVLDKGDHERVRAVLAALTELHARFHGDEELRTAIRSRVDDAERQVARDLYIDAMLRMARGASAAGEQESAEQFLRREGVSDEALEWVGPILALSLVIDSQN